jgi:1,4-alpha-glucan branching enzyme
VGAQRESEANHTSGVPVHPTGQIAFVLHSHLPWVLGHGGWPVGEEWLYQAFAHSYLPLFETLSRLGEKGFRNIASLGITPILAAQLDDPRALSGCDSWLHNWQLRALNLPRSHPLRSYELSQAQSALNIFHRHFSRGASPLIRSLIDEQVVEFLGGPATHPFTPGLNPEIAEIALRVGLDDAARRYGTSPTGIWVPECAYRPGQETIYQRLGVTHFMVDEPAVTSVGGQASTPYRLAVSDVTIAARDARVSDLVWSHDRGYAGSAVYRDFHLVDEHHGLKLSAVGDKAKKEKPLYNSHSAHVQVEVDARNFIRELSNAFTQQRASRLGTPTLVVGIDTELLGHWWHEGISWFERVIELLPESGILTSTLNEITSQAHASIQLPESSWGSGKDWSVWNGERVSDIVIAHDQSQDYVLDLLDRGKCTSENLNQLMLQLSSDWAFMVSRESAEQYAKDRVLNHVNQLRSGVDSDNPFPLISFSAARVRNRTESA